MKEFEEGLRALHAHDSSRKKRHKLFKHLNHLDIWLSNNKLDESKNEFDDKINLASQALNGLVYENIQFLKKSNLKKALEAEQIYFKIKDVINRGSNLGYQNAANTLVHYMNGSGKIKYYNADWVRKNSNGYHMTYASRAVLEMMKLAQNNLKNNEEKTYEQVYAASQSGLLDDFYYTMGTAFIRSKTVLKIKKEKNGEIKIIYGRSYHSLIDHYDWHDGLGTSAGRYYFDLSDNELYQMLEFGANEFAMRSYWTDQLVVEKDGAYLFGIIPLNIDQIYFETIAKEDNHKTHNHDDEYLGISGSVGQH